MSLLCKSSELIANYSDYDLDDDAERCCLSKKPRLQPPLPNLSSHKRIERVDRPSIQSFYTDYLSTGTPVILTGCMQHWPALTRWSPRYFKVVPHLNRKSQH